MGVKEFMMIQYSGIIFMLMATFLAIFVCSELGTGFIKNITPLKCSRSSLVLSKSIISILFITIQAAIMVGASILSTIFLSGKINLTDSKGLAIYLGTDDFGNSFCILHRSDWLPYKKQSSYHVYRNISLF